MAMRTRTSTETEEHIALKRNRLVLEQARAVGLLGEAKNTRLSGRVPAGLIEAAKKRLQIPKVSRHCSITSGIPF